NVIESDVALHLPAVPSTIRAKLAESGLDLCAVASTEVEQYPVKIILGVKYYNSLWIGQEKQKGSHFAVRLSTFGCLACGALFREKAEEEVSYNFSSVITEATSAPERVITQECTDYVRKVEMDYLEDFISKKVTFQDGHYTVKLNWKSNIDLSDN